MPPIAELSARHRARAMESVRCACRLCGAHVTTTRGFVLAGNCDNCGSYELVPVDIPRAADPLRAPALIVQRSARPTACSSATAPNGFCSQPTPAFPAACGSTSAT
jgi:hypothetical protein